MKKSKIVKWIVGLGTGLAFLFALIIPMGGGIIGSLNHETDKITASAAADSRYGTLTNGSAYYYSDKNKIEQYRAGTEDSDVFSQKVDATANHGSAANPFVISTVAQWNSFATDSTNVTPVNTTTQDKVFVLGQDIDFGVAGATFTSVENFNGKFYGTNHKLKNLTFGNAGTCGVFKIVQASAVIADVSLDNVTVKDVNITQKRHYAGTLIGESFGADVLNCHVIGQLTGTRNYWDTNKDEKTASIGGFIGGVKGSCSIYRCSVNIVMNINLSNHGDVAGMIGNANYGANINVYDCLAIVKLN